MSLSTRVVRVSSRRGGLGRLRVMTWWPRPPRGKKRKLQVLVKTLAQTCHILLVKKVPRQPRLKWARMGTWTPPADGKVSKNSWPSLTCHTVCHEVTTLTFLFALERKSEKRMAKPESRSKRRERRRRSQGHRWRQCSTARPSGKPAAGGPDGPGRARSLAALPGRLLPPAQPPSVSPEGTHQGFTHRVCSKRSISIPSACPPSR